MNLQTVIRDYIEPAYALLPAAMRSREATAQLLATGQQESKFEHTFQVLNNRPGVKGPARGYWQFELGTAQSRGGVWGVYLHPASRFWLQQLCEARAVEFNPSAIWRALEDDHVFAAGVARLLLFTDPKRLPALGDVDEAWDLYARRTWRPGALKRQPVTLRQKWDDNYRNALKAVNA